VSCLFAADLHGSIGRYGRLFETLLDSRPAALFLGGDLLPTAFGAGTTRNSDQGDFIEEVLAAGARRVREALAENAPEVFVILGNDDCRIEEERLLRHDAAGLWHYVHARHVPFGDRFVYGYSCVPPTPFRLKDWERYDVSRFVDPGCTHPPEGLHTVAVDESDVRWGTIAADLDRLAGGDDLSRAICLFHAPPYDTALDRAALDGVRVDHAPLDVHVGSIAVRRFIEQRQPRVALHGHVHESARLTGAWRDAIGRTHCLSAAHDGPELALVRFDPDRPQEATRELLEPSPAFFG
jgi:Icc-related predicted phosphoesterase